eukprot:TRINITY_DN1586_c0_g1_i1.p2 TRINITY_DN1586_c0_g1~~TRINITY_DN1586_c0_g1_i1.p2  ORF type:complete len:208 (-),score=49.10 TRINITY_DN1586_c0_g1_i1:1215-1778(-)
MFGKKQDCKIVVVGLDNSGKTTLLNHLKPKKGEVTEVVPTVGFAVEEFSKGNVAFTAFDMSGQVKNTKKKLLNVFQGRYRSLWEQYYTDIHAVIFVVDSADKIRMCVVKEELQDLLSNPVVKDANIPILFFANKMDLPAALSAVDVMSMLALDAIEKPWHIASSNALTGEGVDEGINWLAEQLKKRK